MIYRFERFELDTAQAELRDNGTPVAVEPRVFDLLRMLVENAGDLLSKDQLVDAVWGGRVVSDAAVTSCIKAARQAIGDDGKAQRYIKTVHGRGVRFVASVSFDSPAAAVSGNIPPGDAPEPVGQRPSIAILPFQLLGDAGSYATVAEALPHELISELARLRWLFVIARGSSFRFRSADADVRAVGKALHVHYCLTGSVEVMGRNLAVTVELADTRDGGVVWAEHFAGTLESVHDVRRKIVSGVVSATELRIPVHEARLARLNASEKFDAWAAYHLGLQSMYRFDKKDNAEAQALFERAVSLDPEFCRAHAGLSFTHFQNAFLKYVPDLEREIAAARRCAERSLELDEIDPFANLTMGRSFWLNGRLDESRAWLARATQLSPSYAKSVYAEAWTDTLSGRGDDGETHVQNAIALSPMDPMLYAMLATRSLSHTVRGDFEAAAAWAERAVVSPGAHAMIHVIAAFTHSLNGDRERAAHWARRVRERFPTLTQQDFFASFPFAGQDVRSRISEEMAALGF